MKKLILALSIALSSSVFASTDSAKPVDSATWSSAVSVFAVGNACYDAHVFTKKEMEAAEILAVAKLQGYDYSIRKLTLDGMTRSIELQEHGAEFLKELCTKTLPNVRELLKHSIAYGLIEE